MSFFQSKLLPTATWNPSLISYHTRLQLSDWERERAKVEMTTTSTSTSGVTREPFHWRAHSPEHESAATEWPCDGALSGSWSNHVLVSTTSSRKWWWPLGIHGNGGPIHGMHALRRFPGDHDAWHVLSRIRKQLPRARSTDELRQPGAHCRWWGEEN
jgi:hypothetical protein